MVRIRRVVKIADVKLQEYSLTHDLWEVECDGSSGWIVGAKDEKDALEIALGDGLDVNSPSEEEERQIKLALAFLECSEE